MVSWLILFAGIGIFAAIHLLAKSNTRIGRALRESDHQAWQYAMEDKQQELDDLRRAEPRTQ